MDEFDIQTVSDSENPSPSDSSELNSLHLVPDPESENGWRVEKNPSVSLVPVEEVYTEEQLRSMNGVEYAALSEQLSQQESIPQPLWLPQWQAPRFLFLLRWRPEYRH